MAPPVPSSPNFFSTSRSPARKYDDADQHPRAECQRRKLVGFGDKIKRDSRQHRPRAETGERPDDLARHRDPAHQEAGEQQRRLAEGSKSEGFEHADPFCGSA